MASTAGSVAFGRCLASEGWAVEAVVDGRSALARLRSAGHDAVLSEMWLPDGSSGVSLCRRMRSVGVRAPLLIVSGRAHVSERVAALEAGADDVLAAPVASEELFARLRAHLRRCRVTRPPQPSPPSTVTLGELTLDLRRHEVRTGRGTLELSVREFELLEYLMRRSGRAVARGELMEDLWPHATHAVTNIIDVYVGYLRRKLGRHGHQAMIRTVRGVGYQMQLPASAAPALLRPARTPVPADANALLMEA